MITRRTFISYCKTGLIGTAVARVLYPEIVSALESAANDKPSVIWIQGASCSGCSVSLLNAVEPPLFDVLNRIISLKYHPILMTAAGESARFIAEKVLEEQTGRYILIVEGTIPTEYDGIYCTIGESNGKPVTFLEYVQRAAANASSVIAVGTCASYGGITAGKANLIAAKNVSSVIQKKVINIPGCPPHPDWIIGTLSHLLLYGPPELDSNRRPLLFYGKNIHENCPNLRFSENNEFAEQFGEDKCIGMLGCKGPNTAADCPTRLWNNKRNWCVGARGICVGCVEPGFGEDISPFFS